MKTKNTNILISEDFYKGAVTATVRILATLAVEVLYRTVTATGIVGEGKLSKFDTYAEASEAYLEAISSVRNEGYGFTI